MKIEIDEKDFVDIFLALWDEYTITAWRDEQSFLGFLEFLREKRIKDF